MKKLLLISPWLADFGHGILITVLLLYLFGMESSALYFVLGLVFSVMPDLDGLKELVRFGSVDAGEHGDHRDGLHYPLVWVVVGMVIMFFNLFVGTLFILCVLAHFLNDSWGTGWGVEWLWPLNNRSYKFFSRHNADADVTLQSLVTSWDPVSKNETAKKLGNRNWLEHHYGRPTIISGIEYGTFAIAVFVMIAYLSS